MDCKVLEERIRSGFSQWTRVQSRSPGVCTVTLPFWDDSGDPFRLTVSVENGRVLVDDAGSVAGLLFSLDQHEEGTPAFKLLEDLERSHQFEVDFDEGLIKLSVAEDDLYKGLSRMAKLVFSLHTVVPHMRVVRRRTSSLGPRLRSKIVRRYRELEILDQVERNHEVESSAGPNWTVDFHWLVGSNGFPHGVNVVAADLGVADPLAKAHRIVSLSVDLGDRLRRGADQLRVVFETGNDNPLSVEAGQFLRFHSDRLTYDVFDLQIADDASRFYEVSVRELTRSIEESWRTLMVPQC